MSTFASSAAPPALGGSAPSGSTPADVPAPLLPRYRRPLSFGAILDEAFRVYRRAWWPMLITLGAWEIPFLLTQVVFGRLELEVDARAGPESAASLVLLSLDSLISALLAVPAAVVAASLVDRVLRGAVPRAADVPAEVRRTLRTVPAAVLGSLYALLLTIVCAAVAALLFVITFFGVLGSLVALVCLLAWWRNPRSRGGGLRRTIILATPGGLALYYFVLWSLVVPAAVLERRRAGAAMERSAALVRGAWFRTFAVLVLVVVAATVLSQIPWTLMTGVLFLIQGTYSWDPEAGGILYDACTALGWALFGGIAFAGTTLLFIDLRNRREGTDLVERIDRIDRAAERLPTGPVRAAPGTLGRGT